MTGKAHRRSSYSAAVQSPTVCEQSGAGEAVASANQRPRPRHVLGTVRSGKGPRQQGGPGHGRQSSAPGPAGRRPREAPCVGPGGISARRRARQGNVREEAERAEREGGDGGGRVHSVTSVRCRGNDRVSWPVPVVVSFAFSFSASNSCVGAGPAEGRRGERPWRRR
jgi:hypothetical protein